MKQCCACKETKPVAAFQKNGRASDGLQSRCRPCRSEYGRQNPQRRDPEYYKRWKAANPGKAKMYSMRARHGIDARVVGPCAICGCSEALDVDHDHACCPGNKSCEKCRRGLLCRRCNRAIGMFEDVPELLEAAAEYLRRPPGVSK